jgi:hypothetical protein
MKYVAGLDRYTIRARLAPALLVALPIGLATFAWFPDGVRIWGAVWAFIAWSGGTALLAQIGRDAGRRKEPSLFEMWGGKPTTRMLRHRETQNASILERRHKKLKALIRNVKLPTTAEEAAEPAAADSVYESCAAFLRERTRDHNKFPLVFEENCSYGFRRNLLGLKPVGLALAVAGGIAVATVPLAAPAARVGDRLAVVVISGGVNLLLTLGWLFIFTPSWVRVPADAYAERLLGAIESL